MTVDLEFLIQKEGDFAWLPLESLTVEILVGRYQLIAQASEADCPIQVHIRHQYVQDGIWQEVVQQELLRTDSQGRIEVLAPTFLQHGRWLISCAPQKGKHIVDPEINRHCVQLQVLEQETDLDQDWEFLDQPIGTHAELELHGADLLAPLQTADISSKTAWNNFAPPETSIPTLAKEVEFTATPTADSLEHKTPKGVKPSSNHTSSQTTPLEPSLPQLPDIPKDVPPVRFQISPGLILPPVLFNPDPAEDELSLPQLPVFPHLDHWEKLSYQELSIALGRLHWSKLDAHGKTIDLDFESLELQERFLQTLNGLALQEVLHHKDSPAREKEDLVAVVTVPTEGES